MKTSLKTPLASVMAVAVMTVAAGHALAQSTDPSAPKTREQVRAELMEAQRTGDILANDDSGKKLNELYPSRYPAHAGTQGVTRAEVKSELLDARRSGDMLATDDSGKKLNELYPSRYPAQHHAQGVSRAEVKSELLDAKRRGDVIVQGDAGKKLNELYPKPHMRKSRMQ